MAVRQLKRYVSWVQNVVRQFGPYLLWAEDILLVMGVTGVEELIKLVICF